MRYKYLKGKNNPKYKDGRTLKLNYCIDCGKQLSDYRAKRCFSCVNKNRFKGKTYEEMYGKEKAKQLKKIRKEMASKVKRTKKWGENISKAKIGISISEQTKQKIKDNCLHLSGKDNPNWTGGLPKCIDCGKQVLNYKAKRCRQCWQNSKNKTKSPNYCIDCGIKITYQSKRCKDCSNKFQSKQMIGKYMKEKNPNWKGGKSFEIYPEEFNQQLKDKIRKRDNYTCQKCSMTEEEYAIIFGKVLDVHHIDYNKQNCKEDNLITLCNQCNSRANHNRDYWQKFYKEKLLIIVKQVRV